MSEEKIGLYGMVRIDGETTATRAMKEVRQGFEEAGKAAEKTGQQISAATRRFQDLVEHGERLKRFLVGTAATAGGFWIADRIRDSSQAAMDAASSYQSLEARLTALVGSADAAHRKLKMAELVAAPSPFTTKQLADAAVTLEAFGVNAERSLLVLGKLGAAMGATNERMQVFVRGMGRLGQGQLPELDVLADMGISKADFAARGVTPDQHGMIDPTAGLQALSDIVEAKFGKILDQMANTAEAKRASLEDAGEKAMRSFGTGLLRAAAPSMGAWTKVLNGLNASGVLDQVTDKLTTAFLGVFGGDRADAVARFVSKALAYLYEIPETMRVIGHDISLTWSVVSNNVSEFFGMVENRVIRAYATVGAIGAGIRNVREKTLADVHAFFAVAEAKIYQVSNGLAKTMDGISLGWNALKGTFGQLFDYVEARVQKFLGPFYAFVNTLKTAAGEAIAPLKDIFTGAEGAFKMGWDAYMSQQKIPDLKTPNYMGFEGWKGLPDYDKVAADFYKRIKPGMTDANAPIPDTSQMPWLTRPSEQDAKEQSLDELKGIRDNTRKTARELGDMRRQVLGGGDRAQIGATAAELRGGGAPYGSKVRLGDFGMVPVELLLKLDQAGAQRMIRVEQARAGGRGFNPR